MHLKAAAAAAVGGTKDTRLLNILKQKTENIDVKKHAVEFMESVGSFEKMREALAAIKGDIASAIAALGEVHPI